MIPEGNPREEVCGKTNKINKCTARRGVTRADLPHLHIWYHRKLTFVPLPAVPQAQYCDVPSTAVPTTSEQILAEYRSEHPKDFLSRQLAQTASREQLYSQL